MSQETIMLQGARSLLHVDWSDDLHDALPFVSATVENNPFHLESILRDLLGPSLELRHNRDSHDFTIDSTGSTLQQAEAHAHHLYQLLDDADVIYGLR